VGGPTGTAINLPAAGTKAATSGVGIALGSINGAFNIDAALTAGESNGNVRFLSTPRVSTQNNVEAEIAQGLQIPYQTIANNTVTTSFKDAALTLKVTPQITAAGTVILKISVDNGSIGELIPTGNGDSVVPSIATQRAITTVLLGDGQTTVIGGIYSSENRVNNDRTPGLGKLPLLKWLFRRDSVSDENSELLIFITPRITQS
jgi:type IV pilus assembly protein PilQ